MTRSRYAQQVGEWIYARRGELGMTQAELAAAAGVQQRTVGNVERGDTTVTPKMLGAWERALCWQPGSLAEAYRAGIRPAAAGSGGEAPPGVELLDVAGIPREYARDESVVDVLNADVGTDDKVAMLRLWWEHRQTFERMFDHVKRKAR